MMEKYVENQLGDTKSGEWHLTGLADVASYVCGITGMGYLIYTLLHQPVSISLLLEVSLGASYIIGCHTKSDTNT